MGIIRRIKKRLPLVGGKQEVKPTPKPAPRPWTPPEEEPEPVSARGDQEVAPFIDELVKGNKLVLFMKGNPQQPQCGFSANAAAILGGYGVDITHFDVLSDMDVREGIKQYSNWPTIPQIFVDGEFVGGSDILSQLHESGDLKELLS